MLTRSECSVYKAFVDKYQLYLYPLLGSRIARLYGRNDGTVIDMGTGPGYLSTELSRRLKASIHAIDINPAMLSLALEHAHQIGATDQLCFRLADVHHLPFSDRSADLIVSYSCFHHWVDPILGLSECYRILAPGGLLLLIDTMPSQQVPQTLELLRRTVSEPEYFRFIEEAFSESYSIEEVTNMAKQAGIPHFQIEPFSFDEMDLIESMDVFEKLDTLPFEEDMPEDESTTWILQVSKER